MTLTPAFLADLERVYAGLRPQPFTAAFLAGLERVHATLPVASDGTLRSLAAAFDAWRAKTKEYIYSHLADLDADDPLRCPISLFRTMDYGRLETAHTRALAWLLNPDGEHGFGSALLEALMRRLAGGDHFDRLHVKCVESEFPLEGSAGQGRLDVLAEGEWDSQGMREPWTLVIEAKVDAREGEGQLDKYDEWFEKYTADRTPYRIFLSPDGRLPETGVEDWMPMSYFSLVQVFRSVYGNLRDKPGFHFLRFYLAGVLHDVCGLPRQVSADAPDPYAVAAYLRTAIESLSGGTSHDSAR